MHSWPSTITGPDYSGLDWWTGLVDWTDGLDWWTGLMDWTGGLTLKNQDSLACRAAYVIVLGLTYAALQASES